jgi:hypothetical protein
MDRANAGDLLIELPAFAFFEKDCGGSAERALVVEKLRTAWAR